jgi:cytidyltransferase-like protein
MKIVLITGGFDPLHSGHITYIQAARKLAGKTGKLIVGVNSDAWLKSKKDYVVLDVDQRADIIENITGVDSVIEFDDSDGTAIDAIEQVKKMHPKDDIIFANGGDRTKDNIPEMKIKGVTFKFGVGGREKVYSSSDIIASVTSQLKETVERKWGSYSILYNRPDCKIKELMLDPGKSISLQKHEIRSETWQVIDGECEVGTGKTATKLTKKKITRGDIITVPYETWHVLKNVGNYPAVLIEIQSGSQLDENDIIRK